MRVNKSTWVEERGNWKLDFVQRVIDWRHRRPFANVAESSESPGGERGDDAPVTQIFAFGIADM